MDQSHGNKLKQARQWQPIPLVAWSLFLGRRQDRGPIWNGYHGDALTNDSLARMRRTLQRVVPGFAWKRFRKTYATILAAAGNDVVMVSRLLRHSAGGKNVSIAQRHYLGRSDNLFRAAVDDAFEPYRATILVTNTGSPRPLTALGECPGSATSCCATIDLTICKSVT